MQLTASATATVLHPPPSTSPTKDGFHNREAMESIEQWIVFGQEWWYYLSIRAVKFPLRG
jgi:hypothetical protein